MNKVPLTVKGAEKLKSELQQLKQVERPKVIAAIAEAREHGDLKENAEYHAAREQQSFIEGRIKEIESKLSFAQIIDVTKLENSGRVVFGVTVDLVALDDEREVTYQIVGEDEAEIEQGKISITSPIARALIGKEEGDIAEVQAPSGVIEYEIVEVKYILPQQYCFTRCSVCSQSSMADFFLLRLNKSAVNPIWETMSDLVCSQSVLRSSSLDSRSSARTFTLISSWASRASSVASMTVSLRP